MMLSSWFNFINHCVTWSNNIMTNKKLKNFLIATSSMTILMGGWTHVATASSASAPLVMSFEYASSTLQELNRKILNLQKEKALKSKARDLLANQARKDGCLVDKATDDKLYSEEKQLSNHITILMQKQKEARKELLPVIIRHHSEELLVLEKSPDSLRNKSQISLIKENLSKKQSLLD